jgi:hypothetical protein
MSFRYISYTFGQHGQSSGGFVVGNDPNNGAAVEVKVSNQNLGVDGAQRLLDIFDQLRARIESGALNRGTRG